VPQCFLPAPSGAAGLTWQPMLLGAATIQYLDVKRKVDATHQPVFLAPIDEGPTPVNWDDAAESEVDAAALSNDPPAAGLFALPAPAAAQPKNYTAWKREFVAWLAASRKLTLYRSPATGLVSEPGESERDFRVRNAMAAREARDAAGRMRKESRDVARGAETVEAVREQLAALESEIEAQSAALQTALDAMNEPLEAVEIRAKRTNISVRLVALAWTPRES
jgi:hypothetical protein